MLSTDSALAVKHRRTKSSAAKRERQAIVRRAPVSLRRAVHSGAARSAERLDAGDGLDRCSLCIVDLPKRATFFRKIAGMKNLVADLLFWKAAACGV